MSGRLHDIEVLKVHDTGKATLFRLEEDGNDIWIPNAAIEEHVEIEHQHGQVWTMTAPEWFLQARGLI